MGVEITDERVLDQLHRILEHPSFQLAKIQAELLEYLVEKTLAGDFDRHSGLTLVEDFYKQRRGPELTESGIKKAIRRIRERLTAYYQSADPEVGRAAGPGANDPLVLAIPAGGFKVIFTQRRTTRPPKRKLPGLKKKKVVVAVRDDSQRSPRSPAALEQIASGNINPSGTALELLCAIEKAKAKDDTTLNKINALVAAFLAEDPSEKWSRIDPNAPFAQSLDASKALRLKLKNWTPWAKVIVRNKYYCSYGHKSDFPHGIVGTHLGEDGKPTGWKPLATEELAELFAIICAIYYDRRRRRGARIEENPLKAQRGG